MKYDTIYGLLRAQAERAPEAPAIHAPGRSPLTYGGLLSQVDGVVQSLKVRGVHRSDRVAIVLPNCPEMAVAFLGVAASAVCAPLNPTYSRSEFEFYLSDLKPKTLIVQSGMDSVASAAADSRGIPITELLPKTESAAGLFTLRSNEQPLPSDCGFPQADSIALILHTSGTTSRPKMVPLTHANLLASAGNIAATLRLSEADRCLNVMPLFHIHGLVGALLSSVMAGASVICTPGFDIEQCFLWLEAFRPTWYTAVPTIHHAVLARAQADRSALRNHSLKFIRSSSSALPAWLIQGLEEIFKVPVIESYGMTEAAHEIASNPMPPGQRKVGSVGLAAGPEVSVMDATGNLLSSGEIGEIVIRGVNVTSGYMNRPDFNKESLAHGWFKTGDQGYLDGDGYLFIKGRLKEIINRGGEKISPREVEDVILQHPAVAEAISFAMPHETLGEDVAAAVVLWGNAAVTEVELQRFVAARLAEFKIPRRVLFVDEIPKSATGKPQRIGLAEKLGALLSGQSIHEFLAPHSRVEKTLAAIWSEVLGVEPIGIRDNFFNLGGDSIRAMQVISRIRESMQTELSILSFFETPTVAGLAEFVEKTPRTSPLLQAPPMQPVARNGELPLSFAQQRLWFVNQLEPANPVYNRPLALRLTGQLQAQVIEQCVNEIVRRHEVLRTNFPDHDGEPIQVISPNLTVDLPLIDLSCLPKSEREAEVLRQAIRESQQPFDLARGALLRTLLYRLGKQDHLLLFVTHHIVFDGWSDSVLLGEIAALYRAIVKGTSTSLSDVPIQYADYATWQRQQNEENTPDTDLSYWKQKLSNPLSLLSLPTDRPRPAVRSCRGARKVFTLSAVLSRRLKELSSHEQATLFMTIVAAFKTLLYRYTGQEDILVGVPTAGRNRVEIEQLLGAFNNTVVLRADLSGEPSFHDLLHRVREVALGAYTHQDLPFEKLIEVLQPHRDLSRHPLFDVMFQLRNTPQPEVALPGLRVTCVDLDIGVAKFDLTLEVVDEDEGLKCRFEYNTDLFDSATVNRMAGHFQHLLEGIVTNPEQRISELPLLTESEKHQLSAEWNDTKRDYPSDKCIHQLFEGQVERTPEAVAVVFEDQQLTYRELNHKANQLAHYLRKRGVRPETLVAVCMERSLEMVIAILGILKAGGVYVPLDPHSPTDRLTFMLRDTRAPLILTQERFSSFLAEFTDQRIHLDSAWGNLSLESKENPDSQAGDENGAYLIYTSGSTGTPKGVLNVHGGLRNRLQWMQKAYRLTPANRVLQKTPFTFDVSIWEFLWPLISGACLVMARPGGERDSAYLVQLIKSQQITTLHFVPSMLRAFLQEAGVESCTTLRQVFCSGEALSYELQQRVFERTGAALFNLYGPTEASIDVTAWECRRHSDRKIVPIGRPIANTQIYVLDRHLQPVPIGVAGELHIGGRGLARGYLNQRELTAAKFIYHSFSAEPPRRLYKTGDLGRYLPDGNIEFLGRIDNQVKIRGYRIELDEIETALDQHPAIQSSVVVVREDEPGDKRLVGYVTTRRKEPFDAADIRKYLKQKLPEYMIPSALVRLDELPVTSSGKIDRRALPAPDPNRRELEHVYQAPGAPTEKTLAAIWGEVLKLGKVGVHDNFFDLGGDSLLAAQLISRIRDTFRLELPLRRLFEAPTVAGLAEQMVSARRGESQLRALPILPESIDEPYPVSFAQERFWFLEQLEPNNSAYKVAYGFHLIGPLDINALEKSLAEIVRRHESLRTTFYESHGVLVQCVSEQWSFRLNVMDGRDEPGMGLDTKVQRLFENEYRRPFDLSTDLLLRGTLLRLSESEHVLLIGSHHITWDHWSIGLFLHELSVLYQAFAAAKPSPFSELSIQYKHYALWQRKIFQGAQFDNDLAYWKQQLADAPASLNLPIDHPRKPLRNRRGDRRALVLPKELSSALESLSKKASVTLFMTFLAAFETLLHRMTGDDDIVVGTPVAGRDRSETEGLIGLFLNSLALRTSLSGNPTFGELLTRVKKVALDAYDHQDLPYEKLVQELRPNRDLSRTSIFQVFINQYTFKEVRLELDGLSVARLRTGSSAPQFDLEFYIREHDNGTHLIFVYDSDLFNADTIERMLGCFQTLLKGIVANPEQRISELPLLNEAEKDQLLVKCNGPKTDYPRDKCIHELFETQAEKTPDAIAVVFEDQQLTYRELNDHANQLARYLQKLGVGPEALVGIYVERSIEMVVGLLGILKAGGAYVPLDPSCPKSRLEFILKDSDVSVMLTRNHLSAHIPSQAAAVVYLDGESFKGSAEDISNLESRAKPDSLAYALYTSGSTGEPKAALITHYNVVRLFQSTKEWFNFTSSDVWTLFHSYAFDFSVWEIWGALLHGGRLVVVPRVVIRSPEEFAAFVKQHSVTVLNQTPSAFHQLMPHLISIAPSERSALRYVIFGGEALELQSLHPWFDRYGDETPKLINMYGITETTVHVTYRPITQADVKSKVGSVVGRPIRDLTVYVLDSHQQLQPVGIPGEIYVGGAGVARGYLQRPKLTAERFISDPFSGDPQARLYRSGDLARWLPNGELEYLGRIDDQVKIRGYRIELGEIEAALNQHVQVREAAVIAREDSPGDKRLVAYVAADDDLPMEELRSRLRAVLPDYMVPSAFVRLDSLPLTSNGKIDRAALPLPDQSRPELGQCYVEPRTEIEATLCEIFESVLRVENVGIHDNFFDLGGHSLLAAQVISRLTKAFQIELPLRSVFESPTVAGLAERIEESGRQEKYLTVLPIVARPRDGNLPLSFAQLRLWFLDQLDPHHSVYNVPSAQRLKGALDIGALEQSLNEIVRRHEALRTTFTIVEGQPVQSISPSLSLPLSMIDLGQLPESEREDEARRLLNEEAQRPFDLERGPLARSVLLHLGNEDHIWLLTLHHIAADGWSMSILYRELSVLYEAFSNGKPSPLDTLPVQYADFAQWQHEWLQGEVLDSQLAYWTKQLDKLKVLQLPTDRPPPALQSYRGAKTRFTLDASLTEELRSLSRAENATLYIVLLAAFQILLKRLSGQDDIVIGSPIANRSRPEIEGLIGFFANTLVLRGDLSDNPTFREFLARMREVAFEAYAHQDLPFEKLVEELRPERSLSNSPLFQVMLVLLNDPREDLKLTGLSSSPVPVDSETAKFDLLLSLRESKLGLIGTLEYKTDLFDASTVGRMVGQFETLLKGIVSNPDHRIRQLPLLADVDHHRLLVEWNETLNEYPKHLCVHQLFEIQSDKTPDRTAVVFEDQQMSYSELDQRANQLAHYLRKHGVGPESLVGICLERSLDMIVSLLGVLKAGGAYVPLDPSYPAERLKLMLEQTESSVILTERNLASQLPIGTAAPHCPDTLEEVIAQEKIERLSNTCSPQNAAYVLFTSGSTGVPKGVLMEHRPLVNLLSWQMENSDRDGCLKTLQFASLSFDVSFQEIFSTLASGGTLVMIAEAVRRDPEVLLRLLDEKAVERIFLPFVALQQLAAAVASDNIAPESLREIITAGEQLQVTRPLAALFARLPHCRLYNHYGPTESHVVTSFALGSEPEGWPNLPPIGRPIANTLLYILDQQLQPVPIGVAGELHIGGDGLARGYLNRPELTAEKFIGNPFSSDGTARLYKTGDRARYLPDGNIEFLGRMDTQVKLRGYRIELGEIEAVLAKHAGVREAAVLAREDIPGEKQLVGYVVGKSSGWPRASELRGYLKEKLPEYMVPSAFVFLNKLPLTANRKVDRSTLPAPENSRRELEEGYVAPRTGEEKILTGIWAEVLKLEKVGIHDNFFDLGGHSLLAAQVISRLKKAFQIELPLRSVFESPTIASLAERIEESGRQEKYLTVLPIVARPRDGNLPLSFAQLRLWFLDQLDPHHSVYNVPSAQRLKGALDIGALEQSLNEIVRRHEALRTTFTIVEGQPVQRISPSLSLPLSMIDLSQLPESEREDEARRLLNEEARRPFDLERGPLVRVALLRLGAADHVLLCTMHHIVSDHWSMGVLHRELSVLYRAFLKGKPSPLAELPIQYRDFAVWQRKWLQGEVLHSQLSYWKKQLEGAPGLLNLTTDRPRPTVQSFRGRRETIELSKELSDRLKALSRKQGVTLAMTLLAAFQALLYRYTGQEDIVVGSPIANRNRTEIEGLIGFFVNTLVLRSNFSGHPTFKELLARVREMALGAYAHQDLPFEKLVEELHPERNLSHTPLFQVLFNMVNQADSKLDLLGLTAEPLSSSTSESKFDLTLYAIEQKDEVHLDLVYRVDLFSESWMTFFLQQYRHLLEQIVSAPEKLVRSYSLVTPESRVLLPDPSAVLAEPPQELVTNKFLSWAKQTPAQPAVSQGEQTWTYEQLAERAVTFARVLRMSGLETGDVVAVHGRRSFGLVVGMIGTLLSGGVLLLIDYNLPNQRKQLTLKEAGAREILSIGDEGENAWVNADHDLDILSVDAATGSAIDTKSRADLTTISLPEVSPDDPAYIFFTSGTSGIPKAVLGCHKGLSHFLKWQRETFAIGPKDRIAQLTSLSFDAVLRDIFLPLTSGATLCLPGLSDDPGSDDTIRWLKHERISVLHTVPSLAESWLASAVGPFSLLDMRWVFFVGEPLTDALVLQWRSTFQSGAEIVNLYGPTETTLVKCFYRVPANMRSGVQPVGSPITETQVLVLAHDNQLCGVNEPGEIVLRTPFRSLGYVNAPEESQKRFVKNPFRDDAEDLIYFTGDAGRYRPDGELEILGRLDDQVKIRGMRVEPAEVTARLSQHPLVDSCIVVGKKDKGDETCLVAYVVASKQGQATTRQLRSYLLEQLPAAMVPSVFVFLDSLPLTLNGKVDRKALPQPDHKKSEPEKSFVAPRTEIERIVACIWAEVLKLDNVGIHDNFFELGGHSLLASQIFSRLRGALQVEAPLRTLFEKPTVASLSDHIEAIRWAGKENQRTSKDSCDETEEIML